MNEPISRRGLLAGAGALMTPTPTQSRSRTPFTYCFNTSTIRGQALPLQDVVDIAGKAGYTGIEPWMDEIAKYTAAGGTLADLRKRIADHGMKVESAIGFAEWIVDDPSKRRKGLENARKDMDIVAQLGGTRIAAPPAGLTDRYDGDMGKIAERYGALLRVGRSLGVTPMVELWGFSKTLSRLGEVLHVAAECGEPDACMLLDVYHIYKGGSSYNGLKQINGASMHVMHMNDFPASPARAEINDSFRVYPGEGVAPLGEILRTLRNSGYRGALSLELFNNELYKQDPKKVAKVGLDRMKAAVKAAFV